MGYKRLTTPSWLICSFPTLHPFRVSHLTIYAQSISCDISLVSNANTLHLATAVDTTAITSPIHSKTQHQVSPGTHVAVPALMGLEEPPTAHGVPLSSMAKSSPLSALVRFQESLHRGNSSSAGFFIKDLQNTPQVPGPPKRGFLWPSQPTRISQMLTQTLTLFQMLSNMFYC